MGSTLRKIFSGDHDLERRVVLQMMNPGPPQCVSQPCMGMSLLVSCDILHTASFSAPPLELALKQQISDILSYAQLSLLVVTSVVSASQSGHLAM